MSTITSIRNRLFTLIGKAKVIIGGTITTVSPLDLYPTAIANEIAGGHHAYDSYEELAGIPIVRLCKGMVAVINSHNNNGVIVKRTSYILRELPPHTYDRISDIPGYNISHYWDMMSEDSLSDTEEYETQYAPSVSSSTGQAVLTGGVIPSYPGSKFGRVLDDAGYSTMVEQGGATFDDGITPNYVAGYWSNTYSALKGHLWMRQRTPGNPWSNPIKIAGELSSLPFYVDTIYVWLPTKPERPETFMHGAANDLPSGWSKDVLTNPGNQKLWMSKAKKSVHNKLLGPWSEPIEITINGAVALYSAVSSINPNQSTEGWTAIYNPKRHRFIARRANPDTQWIVDKFNDDLGITTETVYKVFSSSQTALLLATPSGWKPSDNVATGWSNTPQPVGATEAQFMSVARKLPNGELIGEWSNPVRYGETSIWDGDTYIIEGSSGTPEFGAWSLKFRRTKHGIVHFAIKTYKNGQGNVTFKDFTLPAEFTPAAATFPAAVGVSTAGHIFDGCYHNTAGASSANEKGIITLSGSVVNLKVPIRDDWAWVSNGSYCTGRAF